MAKGSFQSPKGTRDVLPDEQLYWFYIESAIHKIMRIYGYERLDLPVFEETALFQRGVGEGTDIVDKEMYTFIDRGGTSITLRPEFTAGTVRAYIQNGLNNLPKPVKVWSLGPVFRYERPQAGRLRQHTQFNVEALGEQDPALDMEVMSVSYQLFHELGFQNLSFQINSIGCPVCRPGYLKELVRYYEKVKDRICEDCRKRLTKNPLRLLDCKQPDCQPIIEEAPPIVDSLCEECDTHFNTLRNYLDDLKHSYQLNHRLVRGLDYYTKTVFEVWAQGIGAQNAVCGGGRYDGLAEILGGPSTPGVGFASGIERIILTLKEQGVDIPHSIGISVFFACMGHETKNRAVALLSDLRQRGISATMGFGSRSFKAQLREANRLHVPYTVILGEEEIKKGMALVKRMESGEQEEVLLDRVVDYILEKELNP
jgi:histidyl-tRNA synthetase